MDLDKETQKRLQEAMASGDMAAVMKIAGEAKKAMSEAEKAELEAKKGLIDELTGKIAKGLEALVERFGRQIIDLVGEQKAIIQFSWQATSEEAPVVRITRSVAKRSGGGGGPAQKFDIGTEELLAKYGNKEYKDGKSFQQAWDESTDKNHRFNIRKKLIKLHLGS
jgi:hypothetical protein